ncbi:glutamate racemase [Ferrithrix thermotolerans]|uniref:glutamate racemase n=1 Tax=Ferrithrix thermotolerans TaxID=209649 RepID=UPI0009351E07|nr:glutamate racemase [Ferrithrix thermotolerans]
MNCRSVGIFDSGFGGLSILAALHDLVPTESLVYFGDTKRYPYGPKPQEMVRRFSVEISRYLVREFDVKMIVVACNTASAAALSHLREVMDVPVVGVIEAGVRAAKAVSNRQSIGVMGTVGTIASGEYQRRFQGENLSVVYQSCPGLVEFVEKGETYSDQVLVLLRVLLEQFYSAKVDTVLLACTHYPFLSRAISDVLGREVVLVSSAEETAFEVSAMLSEESLECESGYEGSITYVSTGDPGVFADVGSQISAMRIDGVRHVDLEDLC